MTGRRNLDTGVIILPKVEDAVKTKIVASQKEKFQNSPKENELVCKDEPVAQEERIVTQYEADKSNNHRE